MSETVTITMSRRQAEIVSAACEEYLRLRLGQFGDLAVDLAYILYPDHKDFDAMIGWHDDFQSSCEVLYNSGWRPRPIDENALVAETVWLAIRSELAWHDKPDGDPMDVRFDAPFSRCDEDIPEVIVND